MFNKNYNRVKKSALYLSEINTKVSNRRTLNFKYANP